MLLWEDHETQAGSAKWKRQFSHAAGFRLRNGRASQDFIQREMAEATEK